MSAWMFDHEGMNRVVDAIFHAGPEAVLAAARTDDRTRLGEALLQMNSEALYEHYGNDPDYCDPPPGYVYRPSGASVVQLCKSVHCFTYQCSEGDVPSMLLYKAVSDVENALDREIGYEDSRTWRKSKNGRAYDTAIWG